MTPLRSLTEPEILQARHELENVIASPYFRNSKRYPAFLRYVVEHTLAGDVETLKERNIGMTVFGKQPDYDTNYDPLVRVIAGEVRRRLAQYYGESERDPALKIHLATGTYVPEFVPSSSSHHESAPLQIKATAEEIKGTAEAPRTRWRAIGISGAVCLLAFAIAAIWISVRRTTGEGRLWGPLLNSGRSVTITVGPPHIAPGSVETDPTIIDHLSNPAAHLSLPSALALSRVSGYLEAHKKQFRVVPSSQTSLEDLNSQPTVLIGGLNNVWAMRFLAPLRFHFAAAPARIVDERNPESRQWAIDLEQPYEQNNTDYALVAMFYNQPTGAPMLVIAGVGANGTEAASRFITAPDQIATLDRYVREHRDKPNIEVVVKVQSIQGKPGTASIVATHFW